MSFASTVRTVQLRLMGMSLVLHIFGHKPKYLAQNVDLIMALREVVRSLFTDFVVYDAFVMRNNVKDLKHAYRINAVL